MKKTLFIALAFIAIGAFSASAQTAASAVEDKKQLMFSSTDQSMPYRIPAIATMSNGKVIAVADYRPDGQDVGGDGTNAYDVDIYAKIGTGNGDGTYSWNPSATHPFSSKTGVVVDGMSTSDGVGFGDAALVADRESGEVLIMCVGAKTYYNDAETSSVYKCFRISSDDYGQSWNAPVEITNLRGAGNIFTGSDNVQAMFFASGRLLQSKRKATGATHCRVYGALLVRIGGSSYNYVVYSDNFGDDWSLLGAKGTPVVSSANEAKLEELPNGDIVISSRKSGGRQFNVFTYSDGGFDKASGSWESSTGSTNFGNSSMGAGADTNGEILFYPAVDSNGDRVNILLQSLPTGKKSFCFSSGLTDGREKVYVYYKAFAADKSSWAVSDFTSGWTLGLKVDEGASAYSTMTILPDGNIGFMYEDDYSTSQGASGGSSNIYFLPLTLSEITGGAYSNASYPVKLNECTIDGESKALATFSAPVSTTCPEGVSAYYIKAMNNGYAMLEAVADGKTIPADAGVMLVADAAGSYTMTGAGDFADAVLTENMLVGSSNGTVTFGSGIEGYILKGDGNGGVAFYKATGTLGKNKAYLNLDGAELSAGVRITIGGTTAIEDVVEAQGAEDVIYDLYGRRVNEMLPGNIYIVGGKKVLCR